jgi:hypothetical protein
LLEEKKPVNNSVNSDSLEKEKIITLIEEPESKPEEILLDTHPNPSSPPKEE